MSSEYRYDRESDSFRPVENKKNDTDWGSWVWIAIFFAVGLWPIGLIALISKLKEQFQPMLEQKQEKMRQQYGQSVQLSLETDKEFLKIAKQNLDRLIAQYEDTLKGAKEELKALLS